MYKVNGLHLYGAFIQSAVQFMPLIHTHTHTHTLTHSHTHTLTHSHTHTLTHQRRLAAMQGTNQLIRSDWGLGVLLRDTSKHPGWDRTGNPPTARRQLLPPEPHHTHDVLKQMDSCYRLTFYLQVYRGNWCCSNARRFPHLTANALVLPEERTC